MLVGGDTLTDFDSLEPQSVFKFFKNISDIPRGSGNEMQVSSYIADFGLKKGLETYVDDAYNVFIKKPASKGYENSMPVILQSHIDMVCEKNGDILHDFLTDPIKLLIDGDFLTAEGTTLGADNGIGVAYMLAILDDENMQHPPIEALFTTDEETGMNGAIKFDYSKLKGRRMINLDTGEEGHVLVSCAGGIRINVKLPITRKESILPGTDFYHVAVRGLKGGHSGSDIIHQRANSNKLLGRVLNAFLKELDFDLLTLSGGLKDNAIPREADAFISLPKNDFQKAFNIVKEMELVFKKEYRLSEEDILVEITATASTNSKPFDDHSKQKVVHALLTMPDGIDAMSLEIEGLVETSTNLGVVVTEENRVIFKNALRSSVSVSKEKLIDRFAALSALLGAEMEPKSDYPAWEYSYNSDLRKTLTGVYSRLNNGETMHAKAIHAGLECGIISHKLEGLDIASLGPDIYNMHTPDEKVSIPSTKRVWDFLVEALKDLK